MYNVKEVLLDFSLKDSIFFYNFLIPKKLFTNKTAKFTCFPDNFWRCKCYTAAAEIYRLYWPIYVHIFHYSSSTAFHK